MVVFGCSSSESVVVGALAFVINETISDPAKVESEKNRNIFSSNFFGEKFHGSAFITYSEPRHARNML